MDVERELARLLGGTGPDGLVLRKATVVAVTTSPAAVEIRVGDDPTTIPGVRYFGVGWTPAAGHVVWVLQQGPLRLVLPPLAA